MQWYPKCAQAVLLVSLVRPVESPGNALARTKLCDGSRRATMAPDSTRQQDSFVARRTKSLDSRESTWQLGWVSSFMPWAEVCVRAIESQDNAIEWRTNRCRLPMSRLPCACTDTPRTGDTDLVRSSTLGTGYQLYCQEQ